MYRFVFCVTVFLWIIGLSTLVMAAGPAAEMDGARIALRSPARHSVPHSTPTERKTGYSRQEIRNMPILERPNRPGHFYGNTVRRRYSVN